MQRRLLHVVGPILSVLLFSLALWILHHELKAHHYRDIVQQFKAIPVHRLLAAVVFAILSYLLLTAYDTLALRYIRHPLPFHRIALGSFVGYVFSHNATVLGGSAARYRVYSAWGISAIETSKVVLFCGLTLWLGFLALGGVAFLVEPLAIPAFVKLPFGSLRPIGVILLLLVAAYVLAVTIRTRPVKIRGLEFALPSYKVCVLQIVISSLDWILAAAVLYVLLPPIADLSFTRFLAVFLLAQGVGLVSHVPGGLGVLETLILLLLPSDAPTPSVLGCLLAYRVIYYLLPFTLAMVLLGAHEVLQRREGLDRLTRLLGDRLLGLIPSVLAFTTLVGGAILLFSGATPIVKGRLSWLRDFLPLPVLEMSHFLGSLAGAGLIVLARALQRRVNAAYFLASGLLAAGAAFSVLKGADYEEAVILAAMLITLLPCRRYFYRRASILSQPFTSGWVAAIVIVVLTSLWLGLFSYKHIEYSSELWWKFAYAGNAPRFLRATLAATVVLLFFALARLLRAAPAKPTLPEPAGLDKARSIIAASPNTVANLALLGDKALLFNEKGNAFIMYGVKDRSWIALGDPIGPEEDWSDLIWQYRDLSERYDGLPVFYQVGPERLHLYVDAGLTLLKVGETARVPLRDFSLEGGGRKALRQARNRATREGGQFEIVQPKGVPALLADLRRVSDAWLTEKNASEKGFSLGFFNDDYLRNGSIAVVRKDGRIVAFANLWLGAGKEELSIDLMRYDPAGAPHGVMDYLFAELMLWGKSEGYGWFNLGMAPLSGLKDPTLTSFWLNAVARLGEHFYNFEGLREYKEKFDPVWEPRYVACPGGLRIPQILANIATLISGGVKGIFSK